MSGKDGEITGKGAMPTLKALLEICYRHVTGAATKNTVVDTVTRGAGLTFATRGDAEAAANSKCSLASATQGTNNGIWVADENQTILGAILSVPAFVASKDISMDLTQEIPKVGANKQTLPQLTALFGQAMAKAWSDTAVATKCGKWKDQLCNTQAFHTLVRVQLAAALHTRDTLTTREYGQNHSRERVPTGQQDKRVQMHRAARNNRVHAQAVTHHAAATTKRQRHTDTRSGPRTSTCCDAHAKNNDAGTRHRSTRRQLNTAAAKDCQRNLSHTRRH
ncbi:hypothetical protein TRVL_04325 [Trypanosoma vivax]|nr:hypothetical protein TRVL_04325 [Trypanosoma vivax]